MFDPYDECVELAARLQLLSPLRKITLDEARNQVLFLIPEWQNGNESNQIIDNVALSYMIRNNVEYYRAQK